MNLQEQLADVQQQMAVEKQKGAEQNKFLVAQLEEQEAQILSQMDEAKANQSHEERIAQSHQTIVSILDSLDFDGMTLRQMFSSEDEYQAVRIKFQRILEANDDGWSHKIKGYEERELQLERQNENLQSRYDSEVSRLTAWGNEQEARANELENRAIDAEAKRDAASQRITELEAENAQLKGWNDDLRQQIALGVSGAIRVVDPEERAKQEQEEKERLERIKAQKTVYDVQPDNEINPRTYTAKRAIDGEEITFNWTQKNSYIILDDEAKVNQFRLQHAPKPDPDHIQNAVETPPLEMVEPVSQFQDEGHTEAGLDLVVPASGEQAEISRDEIEARFKRIETALQLKSWVWDKEDVA